MKMIKISEAEVKKVVKEELNRVGAFVDMPGATVYGNAGRADFQVDYRGVFFRIETKRDSKLKLDPAQRGYRKLVRRQGGIYLIINGCNMHMCAKILENIDKVHNGHAAKHKKSYTT